MKKIQTLLLFLIPPLLLCDGNLKNYIDFLIHILIINIIFKSFLQKYKIIKIAKNFIIFIYSFTLIFLFYDFIINKETDKNFYILHSLYVLCSF